MKQKHRNMKFTNFICRVSASNSIIFTFLMRINEFHLLDSFFLCVYAPNHQNLPQVNMNIVNQREILAICCCREL